MVCFGFIFSAGWRLGGPRGAEGTGSGTGGASLLVLVFVIPGFFLCEHILLPYTTSIYLSALCMHGLVEIRLGKSGRLRLIFIRGWRLHRVFTVYAFFRRELPGDRNKLLSIPTIVNT